MLLTLAFQATLVMADELGPATINVTGDCRASGQGEMTPLSSLALNFACSSETKVYFGVCDSGTKPNDDLFNISYEGNVVAHNEYVGGRERMHIGQADAPAGAHTATLNSLNDTPYPPATYSYAIAPDRAEVDGFLNAWCGISDGDGSRRGGSIRGLVYRDLNRNGVQDPGESGMPGVSVALYSSGNWHETFFSGDDGTYAPVALSTGYYAVQLSIPSGYAATGPTRYQGIWIDDTAGTVVLGIDFPVAPAAAYQSPITHADPGSTPQNTPVIHVVQRGEWLYKIARAYHVDVWNIINANHLTSLRLVPGQRLIIPGVVSTSTALSSSWGCRYTYVVRPGNNLFRVALWHGVPLRTLAAHNGISYPYTIHTGQQLCIP